MSPIAWQPFHRNAEGGRLCLYPVLRFISRGAHACGGRTHVRTAADEDRQKLVIAARLYPCDKSVALCIIAPLNFGYTMIPTFTGFV